MAHDPTRTVATGSRILTTVSIAPVLLRTWLADESPAACCSFELRSLTALQDQVTAAAGAALLEGDLEELQSKLRTVPQHFT